MSKTLEANDMDLKIKKAEEHLTKGLELDGILEARRKFEEGDRTIGILEKAYRKCGSREPVYGLTDESKSEYKKALDILFEVWRKTKNEKVYELLSKTLKGLARWDTYIKINKEWLETNPTDIFVMNALMEYYKEEKDEATAERYAEIIISSTPKLLEIEDTLDWGEEGTDPRWFRFDALNYKIHRSLANRDYASVVVCMTEYLDMGRHDPNLLMDRIQQLLENQEQMLEAQTIYEKKFLQSRLKEIAEEERSLKAKQDRMEREYAEFTERMAALISKAMASKDLSVSHEQVQRHFLRKEAWSELHELSKVELAQSQFLYMNNRDAMEDFSCVMHGLCKAMELELHHRFLLPFRDYVEDQPGGLSKFLDEDIGKGTTSGKKRFKYYGSDFSVAFDKDSHWGLNLTLGDWMYVLLDSSKPRIRLRSLSVFRAFLESRADPKYLLVKLAGDLKKAKDEYRNGSAHIEVLDEARLNKGFVFFLGCEPSGRMAGTTKAGLIEIFVTASRASV